MSSRNFIKQQGDLYTEDSNDNNNNNNSSNSNNNSLSSSMWSLDSMDDVTSPSSSSSSNGPLYQLSDLMDQLPIKRGLSKYYQGKSQSFATLKSVESLEDLAKRENPYMKKIKVCKSFCEGFDNTRKLTSPKASISKKPSYYSSNNPKRNCSNNFMATSRLHHVPLHKDF